MAATGPKVRVLRNGGMLNVADELLGLVANFAVATEARVRSVQGALERRMESGERARTSHLGDHSFGTGDMTLARRQAIQQAFEDSVAGV
jgi:hypothetical protein